MVVRTPMFLPLIGKRNAPEGAVHSINPIHATLDRAKLTQAQAQIFWRALLDKYVTVPKPISATTPM